MTTSYGSITIVDIGDLGELTVTPESNQPTMVVYSPDSTSYTPDWSGSPNLFITPVVYYGNTKLLDENTVTLPNTLTVVWKYQIGNNTPVTITTGETSNHTITSNGRLQVNANQLSTSNPLITYIVEITYIDPLLGLNASNALHASGQITYGLIQNASTLQMITVSGASAFLYNSSNVCQNSPITLTATPTGVTVAGWQYKNSNGTWTNISNSASNTISISEATTAYFNSDVGIFRAVNNTSNPTIYDEHTIVKLRDGANGSSLDSAVLSNEDQMVPCDKDGNPISGAFNQCTTTLSIYEGNTKTYEGWNITVDQNHGVTGTWNSTTHVFTASGISSETGYVVFTCSKTDHQTLTKTFSLVKVKAGANGEPGTSPTIYMLETDALAINKTEGNAVTPTVIHFKAYSQTGNEEKTPYSGKFKIYLDNNTTATTYPSSGTANHYDYSVPTTITKNIKVELYDATGNTLYDTQTIVVTNDGKGGDEGPGGLSFVLGNYGDQIPCNTSGIVIGDSDITKEIPFSAYRGTEKIYCSASVSGTISGKITSAITQNSKITLTFKTGTDLGGTSQGNINITLTAKTSSSGTTLGTQSFVYTWVKNTQGGSAVVFQLYTPNGNIISNNNNNVIISPLLIEGATEKTSSGTYRWYKYQNSTYDTEITSTTTTDPIYKDGNNLIVTPAGVDSYLSIKCDASYVPSGATSAVPYSAYQSVYDKVDLYQIAVISTLGDKLINSQGTGIIYTKVFKNGEEFDPIKSTAVSTSTSASAFNTAVAKTGVTGSDPTNYCWYLTSNSLTLYHKSGTSWSAVTEANDPHLATYSWSGIHISDNSQATIYDWGKNKAILLNGTIVNKKTMFNVTMEV